MLISLFFVMDFKMIPYVNLENLQKPMQIHHPVVKDENYNLYSDHSKSNSICDSVWSPTNISRKEKINGQNMMLTVSAIYYHFPNQMLFLLF